MKITTSEQLDSLLQSCTECLNNKINGENGKRAVVLCGGTGCLSSNSNEIKAKFIELIEKNGLEQQHMTLDSRVRRFLSMTTK